MKKVLLVMFSVSFFYCSAQNIAAYTNYRDYLIAFEEGIKRDLEYNPVKSFKAGGTMVAYEDVLENFKVYYKGHTQIMEQVPVGNYEVSDYLVAYTLGIGAVLYAVDAGNQRLLSPRAKYYTLGDSIISFYDEQTQSYKAYYRGKIKELDFREDEPRVNDKNSDNMLAFISRTGELRVFYHGAVTPLLSSMDEINFQAGKDIAPYIDSYTSTFKAFYKGNTYELEPAMPLSFKTGDDMVAFETQDWDFKVFYDGKIIKLGTAQPTFYEVTDSLIAWQEYNLFKVFYKGKTFTLETNFTPQKFKMDFSTLVYFDQQNRLTVFSRGQKKIITYEPVNGFTLNGNTVYYSVGNADYVYWVGRSW